MQRILAVAVLLAAAQPGIGQLTGRADQDSRYVLSKGAEEREPDARREVAIALSLVSARDSAAALLDTLAKDKDHFVRAAAVTTIGELGGKLRLPIVKAALNDEVPEVSFAAARALYRLSPAEGRSELLEIVGKETSAESGALRGNLRNLVRRMRTPKSALMLTFQTGVGFVPVPGLGRGVSAMTSMLLDADASARAVALALIAGEQSPAVTKAVVDSLTDEDWSVRAAAIQIMANWKSTDERRQLVPLFEDTNRKVRYRAAAAYLRLDYLARRSVAK